ncbi:MAG: interleukin-like EMT inducer domain-containing protein, partial [Anaerolineae bacterium]
LIALGPTLRFNGQERDLPLPFDVLTALPFFKGNRYPSRYSVILTLCWAVLAAYGLHGLTSRMRREALKHSLAGILAGLVVFEHLSVPLPLSDFRVPDAYAAIAEEPGEFSVLELPLAWRNGFRVTGTKDPVIMFEQFYQTAHQKRLLGGNTSRNPEYKFQYFTEAPVINTIIALENGHEVERETWDMDRELAPEVLRLLGVRHVVLHTEAVPSVLQEYVQYVMGGERIHEGDGIVAYRVTHPPLDEELLIDLGSDEARPHLGEGWSESGAEQVWAQRREARFLVSLSREHQHMTMRIFAPGPGQGLEVVLNGHSATSLRLSEGWHEYEVLLPKRLLRDGLNELHFRFHRLFPVDGIREGGYEIGDTGVTCPVNILVKSAGEEVGDFGHIYVDGRNVSPDERGYNVVVLDPVSGAVEGTGHFDTFASEEESTRLAEFITGIPDGRIVAVAVEDEASLHLTEEAVLALRTIGAREDLRDMFRWEHAIIGVKGAEPGQALEAMGLLRPVSVRAGQGFTEPAAAAAFDYVAFRTQQ